MLTFLAENFIHQLALAHAFFNANTQLLAHIPQGLFVHVADVKSSMFFDGVIHGHPFERGLEADNFTIYFCIGCAIHIDCCFFKQLLSGVHHPQIILVGSIELKHGEFRIVRAVHPLVPEVP